LTSPKNHFTPANLIYAVKCVIGVIICFILYTSFPQYPFNWALVSVVLALSPDNSNSQAIGRMVANLLGCGVGLCIYPIHLPGVVLLCLGVILVIGMAFSLKLTANLRSALSAIVIVMLQEEKVKHWYVPMERVLCVITGCVVALLLTLLFNLLFKGLKQDDELLNT